MDLKGFHGRINTAVFTNAEKMHTQREFDLYYPASKYNIFETSSIDAFIGDLKKGIDDTFAKAIGEEKTNETFQKGMSELRSLDKVYINEGLNSRYVYVRKREISENFEKGIVEGDLEKAGEGSKGGKIIGHTKSGKAIYASATKSFTDSQYSSQDHKDAAYAHLDHAKKLKKEGDEKGHDRHVNKFDSHMSDSKKKEEKKEIKKAEDNDLEKGVVADAFDYSSKIQFFKTGKQIKDKITGAIDTLNKVRDQIVLDLNNLSDSIAFVPTEKPSPWRIEKFKNKIIIPYKTYNWNQTYFSGDGMNSNATAVLGDTSGLSCSPASSKEEAGDCNKWNRLVYDYIDNLIEIEMLTVFQNNLDDKKSYELTLNQLLALQF